MDPLLISFISALTALATSILAPLVTLAVSKRQFAAAVLSANRQRWLETVRDTLAEITSGMVGVLFVKKGWKGPWEESAVAADPAFVHRVERLILSFSRIRLMLNPTEPDHQEVCTVIEHSLERLKHPEMQEAELKAAVEHITRLSQSILKREWQRVKQGT